MGFMGMAQQKGGPLINLQQHYRMESISIKRNKSTERKAGGETFAKQHQRHC
jgi:hypothetical protein